MWYRSVLKARAKKVLRGNYWKAFLVSLVIGIATGSGGSSSGVSSSSFRDSYNHGPFGFGDLGPEFLLFIGAILAFSGIIKALASELIENPDEYKKMSKAVNPYGDGRASERIVNAILFEFGKAENRPISFQT
jgi:predicted outer membrane lipoprotein